MREKGTSSFSGYVYGKTEKWKEKEIREVVVSVDINRWVHNIVLCTLDMCVCIWYSDKTCTQFTNT